MYKHFGNFGEILPVDIFVYPDFAKCRPYVICIRIKWLTEPFYTMIGRRQYRYVVGCTHGVFYFHLITHICTESNVYLFRVSPKKYCIRKESCIFCLNQFQIAWFQYFKDHRLIEFDKHVLLQSQLNI